MNYFRKWHRLIMLEAREESLSNGQRKMWMKTSEERESNKKCFSKVVLKKEDNKGMILRSGPERSYNDPKSPRVFSPN